MNDSSHSGLEALRVSNPLSLVGLLYAIESDEDNKYSIRERHIPRQYTNPPRRARWPRKGMKERKLAHGYIATWDLKDETGNDLDFCYVSGQKIGRKRVIEEPGTTTTYDFELPEETCTRIVTVVDIVRTQSLHPEECRIIYGSIRRLFHLQAQ